MCEANVYIDRDGKEELLLEAVYLIRPEDGKIFMVNIFGEQRTVKGRFKRLDLARERIVLEGD
ncbi:MAG: RNA-binding protein [Deltaproteobacteria bacterium]|nr:MAG: RNA-binding protein [Deltaproteobacteria bacterium]